MDLESLDRRKYTRAIRQEAERISKLPVDLSVVANAKSIVASNIKDLRNLREVATPEEARELDLELERLSAQLSRIDAELLVHGVTVAFEPGSDLEGSEPARDSDRGGVADGAINYPLLLGQVLERRKKAGETQKAALDDFLKEHKEISLTQLTDYRAGRLKGRVSPKKQKVIEAAIFESATKLGLTTRSNSD